MSRLKEILASSSLLSLSERIEEDVRRRIRETACSCVSFNGSEGELAVRSASSYERMAEQATAASCGSQKQGIPARSIVSG